MRSSQPAVHEVGGRRKGVERKREQASLCHALRVGVAASTIVQPEYSSLAVSRSRVLISNFESEFFRRGSLYLYVCNSIITLVRGIIGVQSDAAESGAAWQADFALYESVCHERSRAFIIE